VSFLDEVNAFAHDTEQRATAVFNTTVELTKQSWQFGSELTGSPGVVVDSANLRNSIVRQNASPTEATISTNVEYAQAIEDGVGPHGPLTQRQPVGGFHALALTVAGFDRIVDAAVRAQQ
jgi:hypothetical protein